MKITFNDNSIQIYETDYSTIKKFYNDIEDNLSAMKSTYARRIGIFSE